MLMMNVRKEVSAFNLNDGVDLIKQVNNDIKYNNISKRIVWNGDILARTVSTKIQKRFLINW